MGRVWDFIKRHKKKFIFTGVIVFGGTYLYRYARQRFQDFQENEAAECLAAARRQHHFDSNQRTCNMTVLSMLPTLRERLIQLLNTEQLTDQLKSNPANKLQIWEELKVISLTRVVTVVYSCTMMCTLLRVQLNVIGGYMYLENMGHKNALTRNVSHHITPTEVQERYLSLIRQFFNKGLVDLIAVIQEAVVKETGGYSLKERFCIQNIEAIIKHIRERIENGRDTTLQEIPTLPLCRFLLSTDVSSSDAVLEEDLFSKLLQETHDILESNDFHKVFAVSLDRGFAKLMDYMAEYYKQIQKAESSVQHFHDVAVPIAKLIPFISGLLYKLGSDAPNPLVQELLLLEQTKTLAANIYEAFSQTEDAEDIQFAP